MKKVKCFICGGDGKETCNNPDHGLISALSFRDEGRLGCPVCGHHPKYKVPNGGDCEGCGGTGVLDYTDATVLAIEYGYDNEFETVI